MMEFRKPLFILFLKFFGEKLHLFEIFVIPFSKNLFHVLDLLLKLNVLSLQLMGLLVQLLNLIVFLLDERADLNEPLLVLLKHLLAVH